MSLLRCRESLSGHSTAATAQVVHPIGPPHSRLELCKILSMITIRARAHIVYEIAKSIH